MTSDALGLLAVGGFVALIACLVARSRLSPGLKAVLVAALALRVVGGILRYAVLWGVYDGVGDAVAYYGEGLALADDLRHLDLTSFSELYGAFGGGIIGTRFVYLPTALVLMLVGPSMLAGFIAFSLIAFVGLLCFAEAFRRTYPDARVTSYAALLLLFPSLWYWPSSIGKEALLFLAVGLVTLGFVGNGRRPAWITLLLGISLVFLVRPELAGVLALAFAITQLIVSRRHATSLASVLSGAALAALGIGVLWWASQTLGLASLGVTDVQSFVETHPTRRIEHGTLVDAPALTPLGAPQALANVLARPFVWEASNPMVMLSAIELLVLWGLVWRRRRHLRAALGSWRDDRALAFSFSFVLVYGLALGFIVVNVGIIARQRTLLLPALFLLLARPLPLTGVVRLQTGTGAPAHTTSFRPAAIDA